MSPQLNFYYTNGAMGLTGELREAQRAAQSRLIRYPIPGLTPEFLSQARQLYAGQLEAEQLEAGLTTSNGEVMFTLTNSTIENVFYRRGIPTGLFLSDLPSEEVMKVMRDGVAQIRVEIEEIITSASIRDMGTLGSLYLRVTSDGVLERSDGNGRQDFSLSLDRVFVSIPTATEILRRDGSLPDWAIISTESGRARLAATPDSGQYRKNVFQYYYDSISQNWNSPDPWESVSDEGMLRMAAVIRFAAAGNKVKEDYIQLMRKMFKMSAKSGTERITHDTYGNFDAFMNKRRGEIYSSEMNIEKMPILPHGTTTNLTWGIEVEAAGARGVRSPGGGWDRKGDSSLRSAYGDGSGERYIDPEDCEEYAEDHREEIEDRQTGRTYENPEYVDPSDCEYCGYVEYDDEDSEDGDCAEFVSPILSSFHSNGLESLLADLASEPQNDSAGIHVHVGASRLTPKQIGNLVLGYQLIEPIITESYQRETRTYCKARSNRDVADVLKSAKYAKYTIAPDRYNRETEKQTIHYGERYHSVNLSSLSVHGTVEFRAMGPVYDYETLIKWASFCREMVNSAANGASVRDWQAVRDWDGLTRLFAKFGVEYAQASLDSIAANEELSTETASVEV